MVRTSEQGKEHPDISPTSASIQLQRSLSDNPRRDLSGLSSAEVGRTRDQRYATSNRETAFVVHVSGRSCEPRRRSRELSHERSHRNAT